VSAARWIGAVLGIAVGLDSVRAACAAPLGLEEVVASVERSYPAIAAARKDQDIADADVLSADGAFDPTLKARGGVNAGYYDYGRLDISVEQPTPLWGASFVGGWRLGRGFASPSVSSYDGIPTYYGNLATFDAGEVRAGVSVPLWRNGPTDRRRATQRRAELGRDVAGWSTEQQRIDAVRAGSQRYWEWVAAGRRLAIASELREIAASRDAALAERVRRGDLPAYEREENRRAVVQREGAVVAASRALAQASIELSMFFRADSGEPLLVAAARLPSELPDTEAVSPRGVEADVAKAVAARPELQRLGVQRAQIEVEWEFAQNQLAPGIDLSVIASKDLGDATAGLSPKLGTPTLEAGLTFELPIPNRANRGRVNAAVASASKLDEQTRLVRDRIVADVRDSRSAIDAARERVVLARREIDVTTSLEASERARFDLGESTLLIVNLREQATAEARLRAVDALTDFHRAVASYRAAMGSGLPRGTK